jgi:Na+-transporting NADH:ubiquinone oxidoreductase subunit NqrC
MENTNENLIPTFGSFINEKLDATHAATFSEMNEDETNEAKYKKGDSFIIKKDIELPVYDMLRKKNSGSKNNGTKVIKKGEKVEIAAVLKSKEGDVIYKTNFDSFDAVDLDKIK